MAINIDIDYEPISSNGRLRARLTARQDNQPIWIDTIDLGSATSRRRFQQEVSARSGTPPGEVEQAMLAVAGAQAAGSPAAQPSTEAPDDPHRLARACLARRWTTPAGLPCSAYWRDQFHVWDGVVYVPLGEKEFAAVVTAQLKQEFQQLAAAGGTDRGGYQFQVTRRLVADVTGALAGMMLIPAATEQPAWRGDNAPAPPQDLLSMPRGLMDLMAHLDRLPCWHDPTPLFFTGNGLRYNFDPDATCPRWLEFLGQLWPDDPASIELLQMWFGYCLRPDTTQQKILLLYGPRRSGKGTTTRVLREVVGRDDMVGPSLRSLSSEFGLEPLLGKLVAVISDLRISSRTDRAAVVETLLSISGEDAVTVNRKYRSMLTVKLWCAWCRTHGITSATAAPFRLAAPLTPALLRTVPMA